MREGATTYDAIVVGGGPAGLAAAMWLARYRCSVRVFDDGDPRNAAAWGVHGYLGVPDVAPMELRRIGRRQAAEAGAELEAACVESIRGEKDDFRVALGDGRVIGARRVLIATGLRDIVPEVPGLQEFYGTSIWHCPDCDGPEVADREVGVIGWGDGVARFCMWVLTWTDRLTVLTHSHPDQLSAEARAHLERFGIAVRHEAIEALEGEGGQVRRVRFIGGEPLEVDALFFHIACGPGSSLPADLGCRLAEGDEMEGILAVDDDFQTSVPGVYAAGDITPGSRLAIRAAYEGTRAALGIKKSLIPPERRIG